MKASDFATGNQMRATAAFMLDQLLSQFDKPTLQRIAEIMKAGHIEFTILMKDGGAFRFDIVDGGGERTMLAICDPDAGAPDARH